MPAHDTLKINVRVSGTLKAHVEQAINAGDYESVSEFVRDLIRKDKRSKEDAAFDRVKTQLQQAFAVRDEDCEELTFQDIKSSVLSRL